MSINLGELAAFMVLLQLAKVVAVVVVGWFLFKGLVYGMRTMKKSLRSRKQMLGEAWDGSIHPASSNG